MTPVTIGKLPSLERAIATHQTGNLGDSFRAGFRSGTAGEKRPHRDLVAEYRRRHGFHAVDRDILTPPDGNAKLHKARVPSFGLTLAHHTLSGIVNSCLWAGHCTKVCVVANGNGSYSSVQRAWRWRTAFVAEHPNEAFARIGWELGQAVARHGRILFRPNVNSDIRIGRLLDLQRHPLPGVAWYGYTKNPAVLQGGAVVDGIHVAYSLSERTRASADDLAKHLAGGGRIAVVTSRTAGAPVNRSALLRALRLEHTKALVVDADKTDEWIVRRHRHGLIGDLSAKGRARSMIGQSGFVRTL